ncbi:MAG: hypothetical protein Q8S23_02470 [Bacteroidales bacterium]|jgi:hypothetical protein|nr:hypothetical protein [Bacteroidales bacterium]
MSNLDLHKLEKYIERYPWYSAGYLEIFRRMSIMDEDAGNSFLAKAASHIYSRSVLYKVKTTRGGLIAPEDIIEIFEDKTDSSSKNEADTQKRPPLNEVVSAKPAENIVPGSGYTADEIKGFEDGDEIVLDEMSDLVPGTMPRFVLAGGDYFSREEFSHIDLDRSKPLDNFIVEKPSLLRASPNFKEHHSVPEAEIDTAELFDDSSFYTETLAKIYLDQGFYKRALDVYAKLILLYPEKSAYFATLVKEIKNKYNN